MDAIGLNTIALPALPTQTSQPATPVLPQIQTTQDAPTLGQPAQNANQGVDVQAAEQKRLEAVQNAAKDIANIYVVSDKRFTIFKDGTGQYITRFTSLRDGRVTYIPEPDLFKLTTSASVNPSLNIKV